MHIVYVYNVMFHVMYYTIHILCAKQNEIKTFQLKLKTCFARIVNTQIPKFEFFSHSWCMICVNIYTNAYIYNLIMVPHIIYITKQKHILRYVWCDIKNKNFIYCFCLYGSINFKVFFHNAAWKIKLTIPTDVYIFRELSFILTF